MNRINCTLLLIWFACWGLNAQNKSLPKPAVQVLADIDVDRVSLRWGIDVPLAWQKNHSYGFRLLRFTVRRDGKVLDVPEHVDLGVFKPLPLAEWEPWVMKDDQAAIIAQAIYGEDFEVETPEGDLAMIVNQSEQLQQRFAFALMAADQDFEMACLAGWGYVDTTIQKGEYYLYRVEALTPREDLILLGGNIQEGATYVSLDEYEKLPKPHEFLAIFGDQKVMLTWDIYALRSVYNAYYIERSDDGENFKRLHDRPMVSLNNEAGNPAKVLFYVDSLPQNDHTYYYRIQGVNSFGKLGQYSERAQGQGKALIPYVPRITNYTYLEEGGASIAWEFPVEGESYITEFKLLRCGQADGEYKAVAEALSPQQRETLCEDLLAVNYLKIQAIGKAGDTKESYAVMVQPVDSIPPAAPQGLEGEIDSVGIVRFSWTPNTEEDLMGYRIYRGNKKEEDYVQLTSDPIKENHFVDSAQLKSLNSQVFYTVVAVDLRYNNSDYSETLILDKPDIVPPQAPVFKDYQVKEGTVELQFIKSYSKDVAKHLLYRQNLSDPKEKEKGFLLLAELTDTSAEHSYVDTKVEAGVRYRYAVFAQDRAGLRSPPSQALTISVTDFKPEALIKHIGQYLDRDKGHVEIFWRVDDDLVKEITIYKKVEGKEPAMLKQLPSNINRISDTKVNPGNTYVYYIRGLKNNGHFTRMEEVKVVY